VNQINKLSILTHDLVNFLSLQISNVVPAYFRTIIYYLHIIAWLTTVTTYVKICII